MKILIISYPPTPAKDLFFAQTKYNIILSNISNGLKSFLFEDPDIVLFFAKPIIFEGEKTDWEQYERQQELLADLKKSITSEKRLIRVGFEESQDKEKDYLPSPFNKKTLEDVLNLIEIFSCINNRPLYFL